MEKLLTARAATDLLLPWQVAVIAQKFPGTRQPRKIARIISRG